MTKLLLVDGSSLLHRAFYALPILSNSAGQYTNGLHGFMIMFNKMREKQQPDYAVICFDKGRVTFRNEISAEYKAQRKETPSELRGQFELIKELLLAAGLAWEELEGYEADDLLGTLARAAGAAGFTVEIFSGDKDILQLIDENVTVYLTKRGISDVERWDEARFWQTYGLPPAGLIDIKALMGDSSDNISGVPGIGEKTALKLLGQFGSVEELYARLPEVESVKLRAKLSDNREAAFTSRRLATIDTSVPLAIEWPRYALPLEPTEQLRAFYEKLELRQLLRSLPPPKQVLPNTGQQTIFAAPSPHQEELFALLGIIGQQSSCSIAMLPKGAGLAIAAGSSVALLETKKICPDFLAAILQNPAIQKQTIQAKEISLYLMERGLELQGLKDDAAIAAYLLDAVAVEAWADVLAAQYGLPLPARDDAAATALLLSELAAAQRKELVKRGLLSLYENVELPLTQVLAGMERQGIRVEKEKLTQMSVLLSQNAEKLQERIYELAEEEFNINSPKQLGQILFEKLGLPPLKKTKTGYSTDAEVLEQLAGTFEIARVILEYRSCFKLKSTYTDGLRPLIDKEGKIHTRFNQTVTATGRLSSVEPNLQNIPIRQEMGRRIREVFTADAADDLLLAADYNQIELRVLAHISKDAGLQEAFLCGEDIHARTAAEVFGLKPQQVDAAARRQAKAVNFGIVYGISDYGLSRDLGISRAAAHDYIERYFKRYPGVAEYQRQVVENGKREGYVTTLLGRRRPLPELNSSNFNLRSFAQRMAINTPIQGSAADIIKLAMLAIARELKARGLRSVMILQVHDELIFNMIPAEQEILPALVKELMEQALPLSVPLTVDLKVGRNWNEMEKI